MVDEYELRFRDPLVRADWSEGFDRNNARSAERRSVSSSGVMLLMLLLLFLLFGAALLMVGLCWYYKPSLIIQASKKVELL